MNTTKNKILFAVASLLAIHGAASAQTVPNAGWYLGGSIGGSTIKPDLGLPSPMPAGLAEDKRSTGYKILAGYQFTPNWAVEGQYQNLGKYALDVPAVASFKLKDHGVSVAAVGFLPVAKDFSLIGKAGMVTHFFKAEASAAGVLTTDTETKSSLLLGFGAEYNLTPAVVLRAEYEYFGRPSVSGTKIKSDMLSAGLRVRF